MVGDVQLRRIYDDPATDDGIRVLVDRRWPRGVSRIRAALDEWCAEVAPSDGLRRWYDHEAERFEEFARRYRAELREPDRAKALRHLQVMAGHDRLTLLTATRRVDTSLAAILAELLGRPPAPPVARWDIVDEWGMDSFPASDPPANW